MQKRSFFRGSSGFGAGNCDGSNVSGSDLSEGFRKAYAELGGVLIASQHRNFTTETSLGADGTG